MLRVDGISVNAIGAASSGIHASLEQFDQSASKIVASAISPPVEPAIGTPTPGPTTPAGQAPPIDLGGEMVNMMVAQTGVAANVVVVQRAVDTYRDLLAMTKNDRDHMAASAPVSAA